MSRYHTPNYQIQNALATRPAPKGELIPVPGHEKYVFCRETDWLYSTKMSVDYYPLKRIEPEEWNDHFDGWEVSDNNVKVRLPVTFLRELKEKQQMWPKEINNAATTNGADFKDKFLIGSIDKNTGAVSFSTYPARQPNIEAARKEAARLATIHKDKMFMAVHVEAIATVQDVVFL